MTVNKYENVPTSGVVDAFECEMAQAHAVTLALSVSANAATAEIDPIPDEDAVELLLLLECRLQNAKAYFTELRRRLEATERSDAAA